MTIYYITFKNMKKTLILEKIMDEGPLYIQRQIYDQLIKKVTQDA